MLQPSRPDANPCPEAAALLDWYDRSRRHLPWRSAPGEPADPYRIWLSEIMLQQTTVAAVKAYYAKFLALWPDVQALAGAEQGEVMAAWAGLGYYSRARNLHACAQVVVSKHGGFFPRSEAQLLGLPGVGAYTAAAITAIAFGIRAVVVDGNVERVISRYFAVLDPLPGVKPRIRQLADTLTPEKRPGDFAQAMMDLGATICTPTRPACVLCPLTEGCAARKQGIQASLPAKAAKPVKPVRRGAAFVAVTPDGAVLVRTRAEKGLLGAMTEVPSTDWVVDGEMPDMAGGAPFLADWRDTGSISHVFTHFRLELAVFMAEVPDGGKIPPGCRWLGAGDIEAAALPTVMRKVLTRALGGS